MREWWYECTYKAAAHESTLDTKFILIHSNHLPAHGREDRIKERKWSVFTLVVLVLQDCFRLCWEVAEVIRHQQGLEEG